MSKISLKNASQIEIMAEGGRKLAGIINQAIKEIKSGLSTLDINNLIEKEIVRQGAQPSFKMVPRYHWAACVGLNDEVVHSIPRKDKIIKEGDLLKIDAGVFWKGFHTDCSWTVIVPAFAEASAGKQNSKERFLEAGREALKKAIEAARVGNRVGDISLAIQNTIESYGFTPVKLLTGHGVGRQLHESPMIPCWLKKPVAKTEPLLEGMSLAIEVIYNLGSADLDLKNDGWTICTKDGRISALFEETVAVTKNRPLVLTEVCQES